MGKKRVDAVEGNVQKNEAAKPEQQEKATVEGVGDQEVYVNEERGATAVEVVTVDENGDAQGEVFAAGKLHKVSAEVADLKDANGVKLFRAANQS